MAKANTQKLTKTQKRKKLEQKLKEEKKFFDNYPKMKTIHIKKKPMNSDDFIKLKIIIKHLYKLYLIKDDKFHYCFAPELLIRVSIKKVLNNIKKYLENNNIEYIIYNYPIPNDVWTQYGEQSNENVLKHLNMFIKIYHVNSIAALTFDGIIYTIYNVFCVSENIFYIYILNVFDIL